MGPLPMPEPWTEEPGDDAVGDEDALAALAAAAAYEAAAAAEAEEDAAALDAEVEDAEAAEEEAVEEEAAGFDAAEAVEVAADAAGTFGGAGEPEPEPEPELDSTALSKTIGSFASLAVAIASTVEGGSIGCLPSPIPRPSVSREASACGETVMVEKASARSFERDFELSEGAGDRVSSPRLEPALWEQLVAMLALVAWRWRRGVGG